MGRAWNRDHLEIIRIQSVGKITTIPRALAAHFNRSVLREAYDRARDFLPTTTTVPRRHGRKRSPENGFVHTDSVQAHFPLFIAETTMRARPRQRAAGKIRSNEEPAREIPE